MRRMLLIHKEIMLQSSGRKVSSHLCVTWALLSFLKLPFALIKLTLLLDRSRIAQVLLLKHPDYRRGYPSAESWVGTHESRRLVLRTYLNSLAQGGRNEYKEEMLLMRSNCTSCVLPWVILAPSCLETC